MQKITISTDLDISIINEDIEYIFESGVTREIGLNRLNLNFGYAPISIHSKIGSSIIRYDRSNIKNKKMITCFGNLIVTEDDKSLDENGLPVINVTRRY